MLKKLFILWWTFSVSLVAGFFLLIGGTKGPELYQSFNLIWSKGILEFCGIKVEVRGLEKIKDLRGAIIIPNHMSYFDTPIIASILMIPFRMVFKIQLLKVAIFGWILGRSGNIAINRDHTSISTIRRIKRTLENGINIVMFAEGTSGLENEIENFRRGPFLIAYQLGTLIVPVVIRGSYFIFNKKNKKKINSGKVIVEIIDPIDDFVIKERLNKEEKEEKIIAIKEKTRNLIVSNYWEA